MNALHLYRNEVVEWFAAETREQAVEIARTWMAEECGRCADEMDLDLRQEPDEKRLTMHEDDSPAETKTASEWAAQNGKGFWGTTEG